MGKKIKIRTNSGDYEVERDDIEVHPVKGHNVCVITSQSKSFKYYIIDKSYEDFIEQDLRDWFQTKNLTERS